MSSAVNTTGDDPPSRKKLSASAMEEAIMAGCRCEEFSEAVDESSKSCGSGVAVVRGGGGQNPLSWRLSTTRGPLVPADDGRLLDAVRRSPSTPS